MTITIGRDPKSEKLSFTCNGRTYQCSSASRVSASVSKEHCRLDVDGNVIKIKNLDINNSTYVNGKSVEIKTICRNDKIELGDNRYPVEWKYLDEIMPPVADIRSLEKVWNQFDVHRIDQQIADRRFNTLRSATGLITMGAIALSMLSGKQNLWFIVLYIAAILISLAFTIKAYRDASAIPQKLQQRNKQFQREYVCPHCGHFMGNLPYEILCQNGCCPHCKVNFIH